MQPLPTALFGFLLLTAGSALASESSSVPDEKEKAPTVLESETVETIWVEKRLTPATQWIENLVAPLTSWAEQKIQLRDESQTTSAAQSPRDDSATIVNPYSSSDEVISPEQAILIAKTSVKGDVLRVKLLEKEVLQYRVKIISELGEIHLLYIEAHSGQLGFDAHRAKEN